ncbi:MAG: glycosyltransferase family 39 protein [Candidatus Omnitrophica bacterium]|nr:glycosyltransferase family 39 protein [Candidatus Omnitrophota bacterium]
MTKTFIILFICSLILIFAFSPHVFPFTTDSLIYISAALNLKEGNGLVFDNVFVQPPEPDTLPLKLYPPGYSFLIAFLNRLGMDPYRAALALPRFFYLLLPAGYFLVFSQMMPKKLSMAAAGLCTFMFPCFQCALMAWTDIPFLFLSLLSFFFAFKAAGAQGKEQFLCAFLAGIFTGGSLLMRNAGYALVLSFGFGFILLAAFKVLPLKKFLAVAAAYTVGCLGLFLPYLIRNYMVFGEANPYRLPPANVTLTQNLFDYSHTLSRMILANDHYHLAVLVIMSGMLAWFLCAFRPLAKTDKRKMIFAAVLIFYFLSGSFLVILSKTIYFMPERINERYLIQYAWIIVAGLSFSVNRLLGKLNARGPVDTKGIALLLLMAFLLIQIFPAADFYFQQRRILNIAEKVEAHVPLLSQVPEDRVIVSNVMDVTAYYSRRKVRLLNGYTPYGLSQLLGTKRKFAVYIVKERSEDYRAYLYPLSWLNPDGYRAVHADRDAVLWLPEETSI